MRRGALLAIVCTAACGAAPNDPVTLESPPPAAARGQAFSSELTQSVVWHSVLNDLKGERTYRIGFRIREATAAPGDSVRVSAEVDSLRAVMDSPHGRQVVDTRRAVGKSFDFTYARTGGPARYEANAPVADFGMLGGEFPAATLIDYTLPALPGRAVRPGDSWQQTWTRRQLDATSHTRAQVTTQYTLVGFEERSGARVARVEIASKGVLSAEAGAPAWNKPGSIEAKGYLLLGLGDGMVHEVSLRETVHGFATMGTGQTPFEQTATIHVQRVSAR